MRATLIVLLVGLSMIPLGTIFNPQAQGSNIMIETNRFNTGATEAIVEFQGGGVDSSYGLSVQTGVYIEEVKMKLSSVAQPAGSRDYPSNIGVDFGGDRRMNGCCRSSSRMSGTGLPAAASRPSASYPQSASPVARTNSSRRTFAGPVSKPVTAPASSPAGSTVTFAIPPRLRMTRPRLEWANRRWCARGVSGAPSPPAAISRGRKSATVVTPVRSAITAGSPTCSVDRTLCAPSGLGNGRW